MNAFWITTFFLAIPIVSWLIGRAVARLLRGPVNPRARRVACSDS